jgi:hypothetical protein
MTLYIDCHYAECRGVLRQMSLMLNVVMLNVVAQTDRQTRVLTQATPLGS